MLNREETRSNDALQWKVSTKRNDILIALCKTRALARYLVRDFSTRESPLKVAKAN